MLAIIMPQMSDQNSVTRTAADKLQRALKSLEEALDPLVERVTALEGEAATHEAALLASENALVAREGEISDTRNFEEDRARLAADLDAAKAREEQYIAREQDVASLANETSAELESVISQVLLALGEDE